MRLHRKIEKKQLINISISKDDCKPPTLSGSPRRATDLFETDLMLAMAIFNVETNGEIRTRCVFKSLQVLESDASSPVSRRFLVHRVDCETLLIPFESALVALIVN